MKTIAYALFVAAVLLFAGFARATEIKMPFVKMTSYQTPIRIAGVTSDKQEMQLTLIGTLPTNCYAQPSATLTPDSVDSQTLVLRLSSPFPQESKQCASKTQPYTLVVDLSTLVRASQLSLEQKTIYTIKTEGYDFSMQVIGSDFSR